MNWSETIAIVSFGICLLTCLSIVIKLIQKGKPIDKAKAAGNPLDGVRYAMTGAMSPRKKESAFLHLPTYAAGLLYHFGTFLCFFLFLLSFFQPEYSDFLRGLFFGFLCITILSGIGILIKRIVKTGLRKLSNPDDFISNILVTLFQLSSALVILSKIDQSFLYLTATAVLLYIPIGKLKHLVYFFAARYHLGWFYGFRGIWK